MHLLYLLLLLSLFCVCVLFNICVHVAQLILHQYVRIKKSIIYNNNNINNGPFLIALLRNYKKWTFLRMDLDSGINLGYLCNPPPPPPYFGRVWRPSGRRKEREKDKEG